MTIQWEVFVPALVLLAFPADRLLSDRVRLRAFDSLQNDRGSDRARPWWWVPLLWFDPLRAAAGAFCLRLALPLETSWWSEVDPAAYALLVGLMLLATAAQTWTRRDEGVALAPLGYAAGVLLVFTPWSVGLIGLVAAVTGMLALRQWQAFFALGFVTVAALGLAFGAPLPWLSAALAVLAVPMMVGLTTSRTLELPTRDGSAA